jgi:hypothetical protein
MEARRDDRRRALVAGLGAALRDLGDFLTVVGLAGALVIVRVLPVALRLVCVACEVYAGYIAFGRVCGVYGADLTGVMLAGLVVVCPLAFVFSGGLSWGGLAVAAVVTYGAGLAAPMLSHTARALVIAGALGAVVIHFVGGKADEQKSG